MFNLWEQRHEKPDLCRICPCLDRPIRECTAIIRRRPRRRIIERRAVEAAIWGMPAVSMVGVRKSLAGIGADFNQVVYFSQPLEARHEFLTANNQTPYVMTVLDLRRGPVVVEVPPASSKVALFGSAIDSWQVPLSISVRAATTPARAASTCSCRRDTPAHDLTVTSSFHHRRSSFTWPCAPSSSDKGRSPTALPTVRR